MIKNKTLKKPESIQGLVIRLPFAEYEEFQRICYEHGQAMSDVGRVLITAYMRKQQAELSCKQQVEEKV
jgi:hypothetical protein